MDVTQEKGEEKFQKDSRAADSPGAGGQRVQGKETLKETGAP